MFLPATFSNDPRQETNNQKADNSTPMQLSPACMHEERSGKVVSFRAPRVMIMANSAAFGADYGLRASYGVLRCCLRPKRRLLITCRWFDETGEAEKKKRYGLTASAYLTRHLLSSEGASFCAFHPCIASLLLPGSVVSQPDERGNARARQSPGGQYTALRDT